MESMSLLKRIVVCIACCVSCTVLAQSDSIIEPSAQQFLRAEFSKLRIDSASTGKLDDTGERYLAAVIVDDKENYSIRLVLLSKTTTSWRIVARTKAWPSGRREGWDVKIRSGIIELSEGWSYGCCDASESTFKFRKLAGGFPLVGVESRDVSAVISPGGDGTRPITRVDQKSVNWLNHRVLESLTIGESTDKDVFAITGKKTRKRKSTAFQSDMRWTLENFDPDGYTDHAVSTPGLCGSFDEHGRYDGVCHPPPRSGN